MDIQDLTARLRRLREYLDATGNQQPEGWSSLSHRYDFLLSQAGEMLGVRGARGQPMLTHETRAHLESYMAGAGLDVHSPVAEESESKRFRLEP